MYRGFNLAWGEDKSQQICRLDEYINSMCGDKCCYKETYILDEIDEMKNSQKIYTSRENASKVLLDGDKIEADFFPDVDANIFLSHSHDDKDVAFRIKFILEKIHGQKVFIDSCVWGYCNDLLRDIDDQYCKDCNDLYNYYKRNNSTAIVHMMLSTALMKMMDKTECVLFLNTGNSNLGDAYGKKVQTASPWIYHELSMTRTLRKHNDRKIIESSQKRDILLEESLSVVHNVEIEHLPKISLCGFFKWLSKTNDHKIPNGVLDELYRSYKEFE